MRRRSGLDRRKPLTAGKPLERKTELARAALQTSVTFACERCGLEVTRRQRGAGYCRSCSQKVNAAKGGPARQGASLHCPTCGDEFYAPQYEIARGRRFCSQRCMGDAAIKPRVCTICGDVFTSRWGPRRTCSAKCRNEAIRRSKLGRRNPNFTTGRSSREHWRSAMEDACRKCGSSDRLHLHHVVYEQHVKRAGGDIADPDNALTLCFFCHMGQHHGPDSRIAVSILRPENVAFAEQLLGAAADDYFTRYYDDDRVAP